MIAKRTVSDRYADAAPRLGDDDGGLERARRAARRHAFAAAEPAFEADDGERLVVIRRRAPERIYLIEE